MRYAFVVFVTIGMGIGALFAIAGLTGDSNNGAIHEIEGLIGLLIVTVGAASMYIVSAIDQLRAPPPPPPQMQQMHYPPPPPPGR